MKNLTNPTLDTLAIGAISTGIALLSIDQTWEKIVAGGMLLALGAGLSYLKYKQRP